MGTLEFLRDNPELAKSIKLEITGSDLMEFVMSLRPTYKEITPEPDERYLTSQQLADALQISLVTLWSWDKKGITTPLRIGNKKRYRFSDIEKILITK